MGGTFDPDPQWTFTSCPDCTYAVRSDQIWFMPNGMPPHKNSLLLSQIFMKELP